MINRKTLGLCLLGLAIFARRSLCAENYVIGCLIFDQNRVLIKSVPGEFCIFLNDGSFVSFQSLHMKRVGASGGVLWSKNISVHHQMNLSMDGKRILTLVADIEKVKSCDVKVDAFAVVDLETGKLLHKWSFLKHKSLLKKYGIWSGPGPKNRPVGCLNELTHANSIYEIPENPIGATVPAFKKGNIVVNVLPRAYFVFDSELKHILWDSLGKNGASSPDVMLHDVQMLESGKFLIYDNCYQGHLQLEIRDPLTPKIEMLYPKGNGKQLDCTLSHGGVQLIQDKILFNASDEKLGGVAYKVDRDSRVEWTFFYPFTTNPYLLNVKQGRPAFFQQIKQYDLTDFLKKNRL